MDYAQLAKQISQLSGVDLKPAAQEDLERLSAMGAPKSILDFFREHEPPDPAEIDKVRLWSISGIIEENTVLVPGADLYGHGFLVFASTIYGDAYLFDRNAAASADDAPIVIMTHEVPFDGMERGKILAARKRVASGFTDFITKFIAGSLDTEPSYPNGD
jgi:hypothetical protein